MVLCKKIFLLIIKTLLFEKHKINKLRNIIKGVTHGLKMKLVDDNWISSINKRV